MTRGAARMISQWWIVLWMIVATCNALEIQCPEKACSCHLSHNRDMEIHCPTSDDSAFIVNVEPYKYIQIQCRNSPQWSDFHVSNLFPMHNVESMYFRICDLPTNSSLGEIATKLGAMNIKRLIFQSFGNLSSSLTKKHLSGFPNLDTLILSSNSLMDLADDLFDDLPHLRWLDLRENNVHLSKKVFRNASNLEVLELGYNMMKTVEPGTFNGLSKLRLLNLWQNKFETVKSGTFDQLKSLHSLDINSNNLTTLPSDAFEKLGKLEVLNLYGNNFTSLPQDLFKHNLVLKNVTLSSNKKNMTTLPEGLFANMTKLIMVQLKSNGLVTVPENLFWGSVSLIDIILERNYLTELPRDIFRGLKKLQSLQLGLNELTSLPDQVFADTGNLVRLDLSRNHLTSISRHLFNNLKALEVLNMKQNKLQVIEDRSFKFLSNLRVALFSNNQLTLNNTSALYHDEYGKKSPFHDCNALEELHLDKNNISEIFGDWIISSLKLRVLNLRYNQIPYISTADLQFVSNNIKVDLSHNNISHIYLNAAEEVARLQNTTRDVIIMVDHNPINCDCTLYYFILYLEGKMHPYVQNYFHIIPGELTCKSPSWLAETSVPDIKSSSLMCEVTDPCPSSCTCWEQPANKAFLVDCSNRNLTSVPRDIQTLPHHHLELNFASNRLTRMSTLADIGLNGTSISKLLLSNNNISDLALDELPLSTQILELHNNNISKISSDVLRFMHNSTALKKLTLHGNPWVCNCEAVDFLNFIQTKVVEIPDSLKITCSDTDSPMLKMTATDFCPVNIVMIIGTSLAIAIAGLIIGSLAALYYRYQQEIKVWLYAHQLCLCLVTENELDKNKLYDAFISYSHKDEHFVVNELVSKLETGPRPFKLCLHFRDWLAGEWIPNQIARSVEDSRRTIVILSPNFLESVWGRMEFRAAHSQALSEGRARVILILYGDIGPTDDLDPELKAYLNMNTYVKWGDPWFWDKLRYALPHSSELMRSAIRRKIFEKHQPVIKIHGEKKELIYPVDIPETPPAASTPPADSLRTFICNEKDEAKSTEKLAEADNSTRLLSPDELKNNIINKVQCTTV